MEINWHRLLPEDDYRFQMGLRTGDAAAFFAPAPGAAAALALRAQLLAEAAEEYRLESTSAPARETLALLSQWCGCQFPSAASAGAGCEADWIVLAPDAAGALIVEAGAVCFPSSWSLREKAGLPLAAVHGPVPGLNASLGRSIDIFLSRLAPGASWQRDNWGLSANDRLDHHPRQPCPPLTAAATLDQTWLRLEQQLFYGLTGGAVLFGIRVSVHHLPQLIAADPALAARLARALDSMPDETAAYKGLATARAPLAAQLRART